MHSNLPLTFNYGLLYDLYILIGAKGGLYILYMWMFCFMISLLHILFVAERLWSCLNRSDIPMAQFIINMNASMPQSQKFIIHILDSTHLFVQPNMAEMIRSAIAEFRDQNSYEKPAWLHFFFFPSYLYSQSYVKDVMVLKTVSHLWWLVLQGNQFTSL